MIRGLARAGALAGVIIFSTIGAVAALAQGAEDNVVATVNGEAIRNSDMTMFYDSLPDQYRQVPMESLYAQLIEGLVETRLLAQAARKVGLMDDITVKQRLAFVTIDVLQQAYLDQLLETEITDERLRAAYAEMAATIEPVDEISARHILLADEDAAKAVIEELDGGGDFASLAKKRSTGPSGSNGGDLGYFTKEQMVAPFAEAAFALAPGEYTKLPVKTQFGWHVIMVEDQRVSGPPSFEASQAELSRDIAKEFVLEFMAELRDAAEISRYDPQGNEMEAPPREPTE